MSTIHTMQLEGIEMDYLSFGNGSKTFVILPGLSVRSIMLSRDAIEQAFHEFTDDYTVYVFDRNKQVYEGYTIEQLAEDTACVMAHLGLNKCDIFGASQGGMMTLLLAENHPELVNKMVIGSSLYKVNPTVRKVISHWIELAQKKERYELMKSFTDYVYSAQTTRLYGDMLTAGHESITDEELERFVILAQSSSAFDCESKLSLIEAPTLILGAYNDQIVGAQPSIDLANILHCPIVMYEKYGHGVYDEAPDYRSRMLSFLRK